MPFFKPWFKLILVDADTGKPLDPNVTRKTTYVVKNGRNGNKQLVAHRSASSIAKKEEATKPNEDKTAGAEFEEQKKKDGGAAPQNKAGAAWTTEEDEKLKAMKADGKFWKEIAQEMKRSQQELKARAKELGIQGGNNQQKKGGGPENGNKGGDNNNNNKNDNNKQVGGQGRQDKNKGNGGKGDKNNNKNDSKPKRGNKAASKAGSNVGNGTRFTMPQWLTLQEDDMFSFDELQLLSELAVKDSSQSWQRVASKFFDKTGRRVHPDDVMDKFENLGAMAEGGK